ncbi:hypothetical protein OWM54_31705 [Myxococcus sp. MISCRS1]|jgi:hypothetical protein|uniref:hypothetical protein n=1 Tax=Myxococcus TaxID=32 RepID=UPI0006243689|nr:MULTISPECIES: hypothetical protein [unclassified Myxococcus]AKF83112.1 hypothetical protein MFUL124B02_32840 [Myxococcus fulvus 124B02]MBZ4394758.1 hypothetical protein [Myxococcus sp. AS-1-15]MBZ4410230.1 hypothetical protein [Myxococcus sp. XM-1-1-1]MCY1001729.1 hypothetical protein [Myxococcus sp. MISCRS1]
MLGPMLVRLLPLLVGVTLGTVGCDVDPLGPLLDPPPVLSSRTCYTDDDCVADACCGLGTAVTHADEGPNCRGVSCTSGCPEGSIDCGRCMPICRGDRCAAACQ